MISIVAHGILGTAYRQDVVVEEGIRGNGSLEVLKDIRRQLSTQYGDDTPMTGWALQPALAGMWLSRIERAFDANYVPAYVMVSFLIPNGKRLRSEALQCIEHSLVVNHGKYMQQSVILHDADWSFLQKLSQELQEELLDDAEEIASSYFSYKQSEISAYWCGDMPSLLHNMWNLHLSQFNIVYCGRRILTVDKEFIPIDAQNEMSESSPLQVSNIPKSGSSDNMTNTVEATKLTEEKIAETMRERLIRKREAGTTRGIDDKMRKLFQKNQKVIYVIAFFLIGLLAVILEKIWDKNKNVLPQKTVIETRKDSVTTTDNHLSRGGVNRDKMTKEKQEESVSSSFNLSVNSDGQHTKKENYYKEQYEQYEVLLLDKKQYDEALKCLLNSAKGDYWEALDALAYQYFKGTVYNHDIKLAEQYARRGAILGYVGCQLWLGQILRETNRKKEALQWFVKSGKNQGWSAYLAGEMYEKGEGTDKNLSKAIEWYTISAKTTNAYADDARSALKRLGQPVPQKRFR